MYYREKMVPGNLAWKSSEEKRGYSEKQVFVSFGTTMIAAEPGPAPDGTLCYWKVPDTCITHKQIMLLTISGFLTLFQCDKGRDHLLFLSQQCEEVQFA